MKESKKTSNQKLIEVVKLNKEREPFSSNKVYNSALRAGASFSLAKEIALEIEKEVYNGIKTSEIFKKVKNKLKGKDIQLSMKFSLKDGIKRLGPDGFIFEDFIKKVLSNYCIKIRKGDIAYGKCGKYEIDFLAENKTNFFIGECKYRNHQNNKIDINVPLKSSAILEDVRNGNAFKRRDLRSFVVTNTKFTKDAVKYSECKKVKLLGWKYPKKRGLERLIEEKKLYPVTILPALTKHIFNIFQKENILLAKEVLDIDIDKLSKSTSISKKNLTKIKNQAKVLINKK